MRNFYIDNAKVILIFLVVFGHVLISGSDLTNDTKWFIYVFHMPMFILIAGFFEKKKKIEKLAKDIFWSCLVPYIIFTAAQNVIRVVFMEKRVFYEIEQPLYTLWFLIALVLFKIAMQIFFRIPKIAIMAYVVHLFTFDLWIDNYSENAIGRASAFFIFYLVGYGIKKIFQKEKAKNFFDKNWRYYVGFIVMMLVFYFKTIDVQMPNLNWFKAILDNIPNLSEMTQSEIVLERINTICLQTLVVIAAFMLIPKKEYNWTKYGAWTLSIYLFHGLIIKFLEGYNFFKTNDNPNAIFTALGISIIIMYITTRKPCLDFIDWITNKK